MSSPERPTAPIPGDRRGRVLLIDDEAMLVEAYADLIRTKHDVVTCASGAEALELLAKDRAFDVVICDLIMQRPDGVDIADRIEADYPDLAARCVYWSGGAFTHRARAFAESGRFEVLEKPVSGRALMIRIASMV